MCPCSFPLATLVAAVVKLIGLSIIHSIIRITLCQILNAKFTIHIIIGVSKSMGPLVYQCTLFACSTVSACYGIFKVNVTQVDGFGTMISISIPIGLTITWLNVVSHSVAANTTSTLLVDIFDFVSPSCSVCTKPCDVASIILNFTFNCVKTRAKLFCELLWYQIFLLKYLQCS